MTHGTRTTLATLEAAEADAAFSWDRWNAELDAALKRWNDAEAALSQAHIDFARDLRDTITTIIEDDRQ